MFFELIQNNSSVPAFIFKTAIRDLPKNWKQLASYIQAKGKQNMDDQHYAIKNMSREIEERKSIENFRQRKFIEQLVNFLEKSDFFKTHYSVVQRNGLCVSV